MDDSTVSFFNEPNLNDLKLVAVEAVTTTDTTPTKRRKLSNEPSVLRTFWVSKLLLAQTSPYFHNLLVDLPTAEIPVVVEHGQLFALEHLLKMLYTEHDVSGSVDVETLCGSIRLALQFQMGSAPLISQLGEKLCDDNHLDAVDKIQRLIPSEMFWSNEFATVRDRCERIVVQTVKLDGPLRDIKKPIQSLSASALELLLFSNDIRPYSEDSIWGVLKLWYEAQASPVPSELRRLLAVVRFASMAPDYIHDVVQTSIITRTYPELVYPLLLQALCAPNFSPVRADKTFSHLRPRSNFGVFSCGVFDWEHCVSDGQMAICQVHLGGYEFYLCSEVVKSTSCDKTELHIRIALNWKAPTDIWIPVTVNVYYTSLDSPEQIHSGGHWTFRQISGLTHLGFISKKAIRQQDGLTLRCELSLQRNTPVNGR